MSFSRVYSAQPYNLEGRIINVESDISRGLFRFNIIGLPSKAVEESVDRVCSAIGNNGLVSPKSKNEKVIISLAPAEMRKDGSFFDLGIAIGYLLSSGEIEFTPDKKLFIGELGLDGKLKGVRGILPIVRSAKAHGFKEIFLPKDNAYEAALLEGIDIYGADSLRGVINHLDFDKKFFLGKQPRSVINEEKREAYGVDFADVRGQESVKRGLEIAAAGGHNVAMFGPPGTGKTMLARAFSSILPALDIEEILEVTGIHSVAGILDGVITEPPFRAPHHTASYVSIVGGGTIPRPGEITLAHKGVLFLDEFPEFDKKVLESLRQPLEDRTVHISRATGSAIFPAQIMLVAAMNPCSCGYFGSEHRRCTCSQFEIDRYRKKISGPIIDRIDIWLSVENLDYEKLTDKKRTGEPSSKIQERISKAREIQKERFDKLGRNISINSLMTARDIQNEPIDDEIKQTLNKFAKKLQLSPRAYHRVIKLARTIADLSGEDNIREQHILESLQYRLNT